MKKACLLIILTISVSGISQSQDTANMNSPVLSPEEFIILKNDYSKMIKSESYKTMRADSKNFAKKLNGQIDVKYETDEDFNAWLSENFTKTKFSSFEEAVSLRKSGIESAEKNMTEFKELYARLKKASRDQLMELLYGEMAGEFD